MIRPLMFAAVIAASPAAAEFARVSDANSFRQIVSGKSLTRPLIRLQVSPQGAISGTGAAKPVSGTWSWRDGFFCRTMTWGKTDLGYNCQVVSTDGRKIRFTADRGTGDYADFTLRAR